MTNKRGNLLFVVRIVEGNGFSGQTSSKTCIIAQIHFIQINK